MFKYPNKSGNNDTGYLGFYAVSRRVATILGLVYGKDGGTMSETTSQHGITFQKILIFIDTSVRSSNPATMDISWWLSQLL
jgi:hypothetical protein